VTVRHRFAQHFLESAWVRKLVEAIAPQSEDLLLEIGPGRGALTAALAPRVHKLTAVEIDRDLAAALRTAAPPNVTVVAGDVLSVDLGRLVRDLYSDTGRHGVRIVGNLPYNISSPILFRLLALARDGAPLTDATLMLQREVAERVAGAPGSGDWGPLSIGVQLRADVSRLLALPPGAFRPAPRVQSSVVRLRFRPPAVALPDEALFDSLVRAIFGQRRKTLLNALRPFASTRGLDAAAVLAVTGIDGRRRPGTLGLDELAAVAAAIARERDR
jgi:16S rRNA (adenine1518-N6/adenine1519-N6)-dimethyltransferase